MIFMPYDRLQIVIRGITGLQTFYIFNRARALIYEVLIFVRCSTNVTNPHNKSKTRYFYPYFTEETKSWKS